MNLSQVMCCFFGGRCAEEEPRSRTESTRREAPTDLGQRDAEREKASEDQLGRMEGEGGSTALARAPEGGVETKLALNANMPAHRVLCLDAVHDSRTSDSATPQRTSNRAGSEPLQSVQGQQGRSHELLALAGFPETQ